EIARAGAAAGCCEALFTLGDKPELRYRAARDELAELGCATTLEYLARAARAVLDETGLLPHLNPGVMTAADLAALRPVSASMGIMLETTSDRLSARGGPHFGSPDKRPSVRLETLRLAGAARVPFTTGILIGIGESPVTIDHVNPEAPWPELAALDVATRARGHTLVARLPVYPEWIDPDWLDPAVKPHVLHASDSMGLARVDTWAPGVSTSPPFV